MYGKEINVTLEDALISLESLRLMMGGQILKSGTESKVTVHLTEEGVVATADIAPSVFDHLTGAEYKMGEITEYRYINLTTGVRGQVSAEGEGNTFKAAAGDRVRFFWTKETTQEDEAVEITISPNTFPGTLKNLMCA